MSSAIDHLAPESLWRHFAALVAIPRGSGKEAAAREYVLAQAAKLGLEATQDAVGNVVVHKPAQPGREGAPTVAIQGHLDIVCEKNEGTAHNFDTDPIQMVRDGDWIKAQGTTLGADNGIGVAAGLAVMESTDIAHGPLELIFTIDEETGLTGASEFPGGVLKSKYFLNLDSEEENKLTIGCAGGLNSVATRPVTRVAAGEGSAWRLKVSGLAGGHSGIDIHKGRGNAIRILGRVLQTLQLNVSEISGGSKRNAIPREASAIIVSALPEAELRSRVAALEAECAAEIGSFDPGLQITLEAATKPAAVIAEAALIAGVLASLPHGVIAMSPDVPGLVLTSTNLAIVSTSDAEVRIESSQRSAIESSKQAAARMIATLLELASFSVQQSGGYPGWKPEPESEIVRISKQTHVDVLGVDPELLAMHAGLECGVIGAKHPGMQLISFGPQIEDVHSPSEKVKISSIDPFWRFLVGLLERL